MSHFLFPSAVLDVGICPEVEQAVPPCPHPHQMYIVTSWFPEPASSSREETPLQAAQVKKASSSPPPPTTSATKLSRVDDAGSRELGVRRAHRPGPEGNVGHFLPPYRGSGVAEGLHQDWGASLCCRGGY